MAQFLAFLGPESNIKAAAEKIRVATNAWTLVIMVEIMIDLLHLGFSLGLLLPVYSI